MTKQQQTNPGQYIMLFNRAQRVLDEVCYEQKQTAFCRKKYYRMKYKQTT